MIVLRGWGFFFYEFEDVDANDILIARGFEVVCRFPGMNKSPVSGYWKLDVLRELAEQAQIAIARILRIYHACSR